MVLGYNNIIGDLIGMQLKRAIGEATTSSNIWQQIMRMLLIDSRCSSLQWGAGHKDCGVAHLMI
jgi:hypothetical protein